ncbi:hypothetical protein [Nocardiopsis sp. CA-288880]|uniref:hypothetical protein n=1 Tax=Nocardiopsis sp. CA-288880 TaxID=3239995 RepID=UPI003D9695FF
MRILTHKAAQRWPGLERADPRRGPAGTGPPAAEPLISRNEFHGDGAGIVVQAGRIGELHIHSPGHGGAGTAAGDGDG